MTLCRDALPILWVFHPAIWWMQGTEASRRNTPKTASWAKVRLPCASCRQMENTEPRPAHMACPQLPLVPIIASHCLLSPHIFLGTPRKRDSLPGETWPGSSG